MSLGRACLFAPILLFLMFARPASAQSGAASQTRAPEEGIPVTDPLVIAKCGPCHASDGHGNLQRISWSRTTPEGWQDILKDMIVVNGLSVTPVEARPIVKYLSTHHGLTPQEARPVLYEPERRIVEETSIPTDSLRDACAKCHNFARPLSWRRSPAEWKQFDDSHAIRYHYKPNSEAVAFLSKAAPLHSPDWEAWSASSATAPDLSGRWLITASLPGHGKFFGDILLDKTGDEEFSTRVTLTSAKDGSKTVRTGRSAVYGGSAWRGRSTGSPSPALPSPALAPPALPPDDPANEAREVMWVSADHQFGEGRWFWGQYQEFGFNVQLRRPSPDPTLLLVEGFALRPGSKNNRLRLIGENFPARLAPADLQFGQGVSVVSILSSTSHEIVVQIAVAAGAPPGKRNVSLSHSVLPGALVIYDRIDYIKVTPESSMAAFGDGTHPRGFQQFEAIGYQRGPDGKVHTADDVELGPVDVSWALQVFHTPEGGSSDIAGKMSPSGLLTPSPVNPNINFDTWVIATARDEKGPDGDPLTGKAYVVITIPTYAFNGRQYIRDLARWVDDGPAARGPQR